MPTTWCPTRVRARAGLRACSRVGAAGWVGRLGQWDGWAAGCGCHLPQLQLAWFQSSLPLNLPPLLASSLTVRLGGTMRGNTEESITRLRRRFEETVASTAAAHGCTAEVRGRQLGCRAGRFLIERAGVI